WHRVSWRSRWCSSTSTAGCSAGPSANPVALLRERAVGEVVLELADGLVFLVADPLGRELQLVGDLMHLPAVEAQPEDLLLAGAEQCRGRPGDRLALVGQPPLCLVAPVGRLQGHADGPLAAALAPLLDRVDGPQE